MVTFTWLGVAAALLSTWANLATATPEVRRSSSPSYRSSALLCPERCSDVGPHTGNWSVYPDFKQIRKCKETMFYDFSLFDNVDDRNRTHRIQACSSWGPDFANLPASTAQVASAESVDVEYELGWWQEGFGLASAGLRSIVKQMRQYVDGGHGSTDRPLILYGQSGQATLGLYVGTGLLNQGVSDSALKLFHDTLHTLEVSTPSLAMQLCEQGYDRTHVFGVMATSNGTFAPIQNAIQSWANATCLSFSGSTKFSGSAKFTTPLVTGNQSKIIPMAATLVAGANGECTTTQAAHGDICTDVAVRCGISVADLMKYNPGADFCNTLRAKQHVCCSSGNLPDFSPKPNEDGSCKTYQVQADDDCSSLAAEYGLEMDDLERFNENTWGWNGCHPLFKDTIMCLSEGTPPFPAEIPNAVCGPQKPGTIPPTDGSDIANLNPCPLNACCNIWGQCGITRDFCIDTNVGPPGTAAPETYGCISNCGMDVVKGSGSGGIKLGYFQGYCLNRDCLYQDASQIDPSQYTHLHFGFGTLTESWDVETGDTLSTYQFEQFKKISGVKRILALGGWDFSTFPETYHIFRNGVKPANRLTMATKIAKFVEEHDLDGIDIDWEYPGAPDLPEFDPGTKEDGPNYLAFLVVLKNLLKGKSVSIAAPASYWYLKQFPIAQISKITDYIVYMTYDLHGQWDAQNSHTQEGCEMGNCLRSQVNLTETRQSLAMITKAGVPGEKVVVGVTSYGRSFKMADPNCWGPDCTFTGDRLNSNAKKGKCTATGGYLADAEIAEIMQDPSRVVRSYVDTSSHSDILVYDDDEWVGFMGPAIKQARSSLYANWGMAGISDWATDLQKYHDPPAPAKSWGAHKTNILAGKDIETDESRNGNWTDFDCTHPMISKLLDYTPSKRWREMGTDAAWADIVRIWNDTDQHRVGIDFPLSIESTTGFGDVSNCGSLKHESCGPRSCDKAADGPKSGPAAYFITQSLGRLHNMYHSYHQALAGAFSHVSSQLDDIENKFAPVPETDDDTWRLLLIDLITLGSLSSAGPFFNSFLKQHAWFAGKTGSALDNAKDVTMTLIGQSTTIAKDVLPGGDREAWTPEKQDEFSAFLSQTVLAWKTINEKAAGELFDGTPENIDRLYAAMSDGKLIDGKLEGKSHVWDNETETTHMLNNSIKCIVGFTLPALWRRSGSYTFIMDAGHACNEGKDLSDYLSSNTMDATGVCVDDRQYYLVYPDGEASECSCIPNTGGNCQPVCTDNKFSAPAGIEHISNDNSYNGVTTNELVRGSVYTWIANGRENGARLADPTNGGTLSDLVDVDVTTPGFLRIPVCSPERAFQSWDTADKDSSPNWPCDVPPGRDECEHSSFVDQTSSASPKVEDCRQIIRNIEGDGNTAWTTQVVGNPHREIARAGSCSFGVEATKTDGNVNFVVGGQDVIDIINGAINRFERDGRVGAKGEVNCNGNSKSQPILWGIY